MTSGEEKHKRLSKNPSSWLCLFNQRTYSAKAQDKSFPEKVLKKSERIPSSLKNLEWKKFSLPCFNRSKICDHDYRLQINNADMVPL